MDRASGYSPSIHNDNTSNELASKSHIINVLNGIRKVNRIIIQTDDLSELINSISRELTSVNRGYNNIWIALFDSKEQVQNMSSSGFNGSFKKMSEHLKSGHKTRCMRKAFHTDDVIITQNPGEVCSDCPLSSSYKNSSGFSRSIELHGQRIGIINVSIPLVFANNTEEINLFNELAQDIRFAINRIYEKEKSLADEKTLQRLYQNTFDSIYKIKGSHFESVNPGFCKLTGYRKEELLSEEFNFESLLTEKSKKVISERYKAREGNQDISDQYEFEIVDKSGRTKIVEANTILLNEKDEVVVIGILRDVTHRHQGQNEMLKHAEQYYSMLNATTDGFVILNSTGDIIDVNDEYSRMVKYSKKEIIGQSITFLDAHESEEETGKRIHSILEKGFSRFESQHKTKSGELLHVEISTVYSPVNELFTVFIRNITETKERQKELNEMTQRFNIAVESGEIGIWELNLITGDLKWDKWMFRLYGLDKKDFKGKFEDWQDRVHPDERESKTRLVQDAAENRERFNTVFRIVRPDNVIRFISASAFYIYDGQGKPKIMIGTNIDITEMRTREEEFKKLYLQSEAIFEASKVGIMVLYNRIITKVNSTMCNILGYTPEELIGKGPQQLHLSHQNFVEFGDKYYWQLAHNELSNIEYPLKHKNGNTVYCKFSGRAIVPPDLSKGAVWVIEDITKRKEHEEQLAFQSQILDQIQDLITVTDLNGNISYVNKAVTELMGIPKSELIGKNVEIFGEDINNSIAQKEIIKRVTQEGSWRGEVINIHEDGFEKILDSRLHVVKNAEGIPIALCGISTDITGKKQIEKEQQNLHDQLTQSQKLESIGRLAGGVAHDFNNMLQAILGNCELAELEFAEEDKFLYFVREIKNAAFYSMNITKQLLAFARQEKICPVTVNLNDVLVEMKMAILRLIGENITLEWDKLEDVWSIKIDETQIRQVIINLAVNARDAIEDVGHLKFELKNVSFTLEDLKKEPEIQQTEYVLLKVVDDGCGIDKSQLENIFEPFYTTKATGKGTGLGLSMVYGIMKQNYGFIKVESEINKGTSFYLYFPRCEDTALNLTKEREATSLLIGKETVLVVEDEIKILKLAQRILEKLGYRVITAETPEKAIEAVKSNQIEVMISDIIMPTMNGRDLSDKILELNPDIKVLFMSGYDSNIISQNGVVEKEIHFIQKPFNIESLSKALRETICVKRD